MRRNGHLQCQGETKIIETIQGRTSSTEFCQNTFCNGHNKQKRIKCFVSFALIAKFDFQTTD
jgi:hypothetical protein